MLQDGGWRIPPAAPTCMEIHLGSARYRSDGTFLLSASSLTGRCWFGSIWIYSDSKLAPNEGFCKAGLQTEAGLSDVHWLTDRSIIAATDAGTVELWGLSEDERLLVSKFSRHEHDHVVTAISPMADAQHAVSGSMDTSIKVWDLNQEAVLNTYSVHTMMVNSVSCSPKDDSLFVSCAQDGRLLLWDRRKSKPCSRLDVASPGCSVTSVTWHPYQTSTIAYGDELGRVTIRDFQSTGHEQILHAHKRRVTALSFSSHSSPCLASVSDDCTVAVINTDLREIYRDVRHTDFIRGVCWAPNGSDLLTTAGWDHQVLHHSVQEIA